MPGEPVLLAGKERPGRGDGAAICKSTGWKSGKNRRDDFADPFHHVRFVGHGLGHGGFAGAAGQDALHNELAGVNQEAGGYTLFEPLVAKVADFLPQFRQCKGGVEINPAFVGDDSKLTRPKF